MSYIAEYFKSFWEMTVLMHLYIFFGLIVAAIIREFISDSYIKNNLGGKGFWAAVKAALIGLPLPLCSCSVIPLAASLRKSGAGKGAVASFFISTPMTGADSIIATYGVFGWLVTISRVASASVAAILAGVFTDAFTADEKDNFQKGSSCGCSGASFIPFDVAKPTIGKRISNIFHYAFFDLLSDLAYPLLSGLLMAALITLFITPDFASAKVGIVGGYVLAFVAGIPLYVCSISAIPIALSLLAAGFSPGAAFVFLAGAPATNVIAVNVVRKMLGKSGMYVYLICIIAVTLIFAVVIDLYFAESVLSYKEMAREAESGSSITNYTAGLFLLIISVMTFKQKIMKKGSHSH